MQITIPNNWKPRDYQMPAWAALEAGVKRALLIWARRHGKDDVCLHWMATAALQKTATYWYMLPQAAQSRKAIWTALNPHTGKRRINEAFPKEIVARKNDQEMYLELVNGSNVQIVGSDNYDNMIGSPPYGIVFSEWALSNPSSWAYLRPILRENGGWAIFNTTSRGRNHAVKMFEAFSTDPKWFCQILPWTDADVFTQQEMDEELADYIKDWGVDQGTALFEQEYLCSFDAAIMGSYFSAEMANALKGGRIGKVPYEKGHLVHAMWDLGRSDNTVVWFFQIIANQWRILGCLAANGENLDYFIKEMNTKPWAWGTDYIPHDGNHLRLGMDKTIKGQMGDLGRQSVVVVPSPPGSVQVGINETRKLISKCWFDVEGCGTGLDAMRMYRKIWDDKNKVFRQTPLHDWCSDYADAFRTGAMGFNELVEITPIEFTGWK